MGLGIVTAMTIIIWACGLHWQLTFTREDPGTKINSRTPLQRKSTFVLLLYGSSSLMCSLETHSRLDYYIDACYQALAYWVMSALSNDPFTLARSRGCTKLFKCRQFPNSEYSSIYPDF